jgi:hypothetical protein
MRWHRIIHRWLTLRTAEAGVLNTMLGLGTAHGTVLAS